MMLAWAAGASAQQAPPSSGGWVAMLGPKDTVALEHYVRSGNRLTGTSVEAYPRATMRSYEVTFAPSGEVQRVHVATGAPGRAPRTTADYSYTADSVTVEVRRDTVMRRMSFAYEGARPLPFYEDLFGFWEISLGRAMGSVRDSLTFPTVSGRSILPITFVRRSGSAVDFGFGEWGMVHATMSGKTLDRLDMTQTTSKYMVERRKGLDVVGRAAAWAARPQPGILSPRDTASAEVGGANVTIDYSRPAMRGRKVFGGIVPWNQVWRLGANAATQLITDHDLVIGDTTIPAGTYSLWGVLTPSGWTLVVNHQHGQWGTVHDAAQDFARIPLAVSSLDEPVERFTISVTPSGSDGGTISMEWAKRRGTVRFRVK
jgi:hypothetical protein